MFFCRKANEGLLVLSQEETMPISIRQLAYGTVSLSEDDAALLKCFFFE